MNSRSTLAATILLAVALPGAEAQARTATNAEREACVTAIQKRIDAIDARMRQPYGVREGERLREKRDQLEEARAQCRVSR